MPSIASFPDFVQSVAPKYLTGPQQIRSAVQYQQYGWCYTMRGKSNAVMMSHGLDIREKAQFTEVGTTESYGPNDTAAASMPQNMTTLIAPVRYLRNQMTWTEEELEQSGAATASADSLPQIFYDFNARLETQRMISMANTLERKFIAVPDPNTMEAGAGLEPYALHANINDHANTLFNNGTTANLAPAWTTVMQVSPTAAASLRHKNRMFGYDSAQARPAADSRNMLNAIDDAFVQLTYVPPTVSGLYRAPAKWEDSGWPTKVVMLSQKGMTLIMAILRSRNDLWTKPGEGGLTGVGYNGTEFVPLPRLDEIAAYQDSTSSPTVNNTEGNTANAGIGPRLFIVDIESYKPVFLRSKFFDRKVPRPWPNQPTTWTAWTFVGYNFVCPHRWTCGIVTPGTIAGTFPSQTLTAAKVYTAY